MSKNLINFNMSVRFSPLELLIDGQSVDIRESIEESLAVEYIGTRLRDLCDELVLDTKTVVDAYENVSVDDLMKYVSFDPGAITYTGAEGDYASFNVPCTFDADTFIARATEGKGITVTAMTNLYVGYNAAEDFKILICAGDEQEAETLAEGYCANSYMEGKFEISKFDNADTRFDCNYVLTY